MFMGRKQLGTWINVWLQCRNGDVPTMPDSIPWLKIWRPDGALAMALGIPVMDKTIARGLFCLPLFLGSEFSAGQHSLAAFYAIGGASMVQTGTMAIIAGGDADGAVLGMHWYHRPHADFVVYQRESGKVFRGRNPRIP